MQRMLAVVGDVIAHFNQEFLFFSIIILAASLWDIVELAKFKVFQDVPSSTYTFFLFKTLFRYN